jgi:hypothetical protein
MNERIQELAEQAGFYYTDKTGFITPAGCDPKKFAELIVRECMNVLDPGEHQLIARFQARKWLAEHFGVEE